ncbi:MAG: AmmeMemoRadiSam system radical SAM enzyme [Candidatus Korarchaeota archaeon]|nr:AmmeMemoRadiSam system radical SAM enzyme [Candidatus Korarchaeota archaeon]NIU85147.1 AmmeMemoRadiSam system radical SAM enzyme [Candidatus Thorarchaeota archaeon]NIW15199.1 AmmeMemoRadiSam system radical SAM enzyme [Candidatus Thorarchaeota archaeon]NIW53180.1 AmmeMemoRadiSam system radical SAM enzyme [Candidatus Korarchaeota archaeon]
MTLGKKARWWKLDEEGHIHCTLCPRGCVFSKNYQIGDCGVRVRSENELKTAVYGKISSLAVDPIEKKPLFHFYPGSSALSIASIGCSLHCRFCQNYQISQSHVEVSEEGKLSYPFPLRDMSPEDVVNVAKDRGASVIAYTYNEPTIFWEFMYDTAKLAKKNGLLNVFITDGYINEQPMRVLAKYLDAANVDLKGDQTFYGKYTLTPNAPNSVLKAIKVMAEEGVHVEITTLIIPGLNDDEEWINWEAQWILENLGPDTPVHLSRFYPTYLMRDRPRTPVETIEKMRNLMLESGLNYVFAGNVPGSAWENTFCPNCGEKVIGRRGFEIRSWNLSEDMGCKSCGQHIPVKGERKKETAWKKYLFR